MTNTDEMNKLISLSRDCEVISVPYGEKETLKQGTCLLYTSPSPRDGLLSRMPSSA